MRPRGAILALLAVAIWESGVSAINPLVSLDPIQEWGPADVCETRNGTSLTSYEPGMPLTGLVGQGISCDPTGALAAFSLVRVDPATGTPSIYGSAIRYDYTCCTGPWMGELDPSQPSTVMETTPIDAGELKNLAGHPAVCPHGSVLTGFEYAAGAVGTVVIKYTCRPALLSADGGVTTRYTPPRLLAFYSPLDVAALQDQRPGCPGGTVYVGFETTMRLIDNRSAPGFSEALNYTSVCVSPKIDRNAAPVVLPSPPPSPEVAASPPPAPVEVAPTTNTTTETTTAEVMGQATVASPPPPLVSAAPATRWGASAALTIFSSAIYTLFLLF